MDKSLSKRLDCIAWALMSPLEREISALICELLTYPDGCEIIAQCIEDVETQDGNTAA